jgi:hypothetical protein
VSAPRKYIYLNVPGGKTYKNTVENDKNTGENVYGLWTFKYEQILTGWQRFAIIFKLCALCPFPKALWNEQNQRKGVISHV